jgi:NAD(P)-dependent dehydrogenase (short-subunit alcohol dehydrogenase family)
VFEDIPKPTRYVPFDSYAMSKLANLLFAYELDRRLKAAGASVASVACHPGYAATNLQYVGPEMEGSGFKRAMMTLGNATIAQSAEMGALPTLCAATSAEVQGGDYVGPKGFFGIRGYPGKVKSNAESYDEAIAERLWETSETLTGVKYSFSRGAPGESRALV